MSKDFSEECRKREKRPPVPRFPHPNRTPRQDEQCTLQATTAPCERSFLPARERLSKHLLLGRFSKRSSAPTGSDAADADGEGQGEEQETAEVITATIIRRARKRIVFRSRSHDGKTCEAEASTTLATGTSTANRGRSSSQRQAQRSEDSDTLGGVEGLSIIGRPQRISTHSRTSQSLGPKLKPQKEENMIDSGLGALYFTFSSMRTENGEKVALKNRDKIVNMLHELNSKVALPICRHFGLRYNFFSEHHCQAKKAGVTCKEPLILRKKGPDGEEIQETRHLVTIRLRLRVHPTKGDPQKDFISRGTQLAILLHELCHLKHMNHGKEFMLSLREIFAYAKELGVFNPSELSNEIPSPWPWENAIFQSAGDISVEELLRIFAEHKAAQRAKEAPTPTEPQEADDKASKENSFDDPKAKVPLDFSEDNSEAASTEASDGGPPPVSLEGRRRHPKSELISLTSAYQKGLSCEDGCCENEVIGDEHSYKKAAYGEEFGSEDTRSPNGSTGDASFYSGADIKSFTPSPHLRLPRLVSPPLPPTKPDSFGGGKLKTMSSIPVLPQIGP